MAVSENLDSTAAKLTISGSDMYEPLDAQMRQTRLVLLHPGKAEDILNASLVITSLPDRSLSKEAASFEPHKDYEAISYTWGDISLTTLAIINGVQAAIPSGAAEALRGLRSAKETLVFWIDAISINQDDPKERASQVAMMGDIFETATRTRIWLGPATESTVAAVQLCKTVADKARPILQLAQESIFDAMNDEAAQIHRPTREELTGVGEIFKRRWFTRVWVFQEVALSGNIVCHIGDSTIGWEDLTMALYVWYRQRPDLHRGLLVNFPAWPIPFLLSHANVWQPVGQEGKDLSTLLQWTKKLNATDARDRIYALLSLTTWSRKGQALPSGLVPDYNISLPRCLCNAVRSCCYETCSLSVLETTPFELDNDQCQNAQSWPSWVRASTAIDRHATGEGLPKVFGSSSLDWLPQRNLKYHALLQPGTDPEILNTLGHPIDVVARTLSATMGTDNILIISEWFNEQNLAYGHTFQSNQDLFDFFIMDRPPTPASEKMFSVLSGSGTADDSESPDADVLQLLRVIHGLIAGRRVFTTAAGHVGIGPADTQSGDRVVILVGASMPYVLRDDGGGNIFVGPCFLRRFDIEAFRALVNESVESEIFCIH